MTDAQGVVTDIALLDAKFDFPISKSVFEFTVPQNYDGN